MRAFVSVLFLLCACDDETPLVDIPWGDADPFADHVVSFTPGHGAGFGQKEFPEIVLGGPEGGGASAGSLDVLSLGQDGDIILEFADRTLRDGPGFDLLVFENPFPGWIELAHVAVSEDGETWFEWPCDPTDEAGGYPGCAGMEPVLSTSENRLDPTDPMVAGGDAFDLAELGLSTARFVRITDAGTNSYEGISGGFDLDAVSIVHWDDQ